MKQVREVMIYKVKLIHPDNTVAQAAEEMKDFEVGALPVVEDGHVVGILTDRDIVVRAVADGKDVSKVKVSDVMTKGVSYAYEDQSLEELANIMKEKQVRRVVVLNRQQHVSGILSLGDLATLHGDTLSLDILRQVSSPVPNRAGVGEES